MSQARVTGQAGAAGQAGAPGQAGVTAPAGSSAQAGGSAQGGGSAQAGAAATAPARRWAAVAARYLPPAIAALAMAVIGVWGLTRDNAMGNDEVATRWAALLSLHELVHLVSNVDAVHGTYYLLMHWWVVVGSSPTILRIPSVIAMSIGAALVVVLARQLTGSAWAGLFAGLIMAVTPTISYYAQTARSYAMVFTCVVGATIALLYAMKAESAGLTGRSLTRRWVIYGVLITLGGYLNEMSLLVLAAHGITVLLARYGRQTVRHWIRAAAISAALVLPLVLLSIKERGAVDWITRPGLPDVVVLIHDYFGATALVPAFLVACAIIGALPPRGTWRKRARGADGQSGLAASAAPQPGVEPSSGVEASSGAIPLPGTASQPSAGPKAGPQAGAAPPAGAGPQAPWWRSGGISLPSVAVPLLLVPAGLLLLESRIGPPLYVDRYVLYGEAGAALLAGAGLYRIGQWLRRAVGWRALVWMPGLLVCIGALLLQLGQQQRFRTPQSREYDYGGPSFYVGAHARQGDGLMFFGSFFRKARLGYPADFAKTRDFAMAESPTQAGDFRGRNMDFKAADPLMLTYQRIWVIGKVPSAHLPPGSLRDESLVLRHRFSLVRERRYRGMVVTLWVRRS